MTSSKNLKIQLIIMVSFFIFFYVFFALATSIYRDYKLESHLEKFEGDIERLEKLVYSKPEEVRYFASVQYKDKYAKENLNLINPGEKVIIIPREDQGVLVEESSRSPEGSDIVKQPPPQQWWQYFFGPTLSISPLR